MKTKNDDQTPDLLPDGLPAFDLDPAYPWPMPKAADRTPAAARQRVLEPFKRWLERAVL